MNFSRAIPFMASEASACMAPQLFLHQPPAQDGVGLPPLAPQAFGVYAVTPDPSEPEVAAPPPKKLAIRWHEPEVLGKQPSTRIPGRPTAMGAAPSAAPSAPPPQPQQPAVQLPPQLYHHLVQLQQLQGLPTIGDALKLHQHLLELKQQQDMQQLQECAQLQQLQQLQAMCQPHYGAPFPGVPLAPPINPWCAAGPFVGGAPPPIVPTNLPPMPPIMGAFGPRGATPLHPYLNTAESAGALAQIYNPMAPADPQDQFYASGERKRNRSACNHCHERKLRCIMLQCGSCQLCIDKGLQCIPRVEHKRGRQRFEEGSPEAAAEAAAAALGRPTAADLSDTEADEEGTPAAASSETSSPTFDPATGPGEGAAAEAGAAPEDHAEDVAAAAASAVAMPSPYAQAAADAAAAARAYGEVAAAAASVAAAEAAATACTYGDGIAANGVYMLV